MDKEDAKFILASFRPCGSDVDEPAFQKALELALRDRKLGEWLVAERAFDAQFTDCVTSLSIPDQLREQLTTLMNSRDEENSKEDLQIIGALATLEPPATLRKEILTAMRISESTRDHKHLKGSPHQPNGDEEPQKKVSFMRHWFPLAIAAVVTMALLLGFFIPGGTSSSQAVNSLAEIRKEATRYVFDENLQMDHQEQSYLKTVSWAQSEHIPAPEVLPKGLAGRETIGVKKLEVAGKEASLIAFRGENDIVFYLISLEPDEIETLKETVPSIKDVKKHCHKCPKFGHSMVQWQDGKRLYYLCSKAAKLKEFQEIF